MQELHAVVSGKVQGVFFRVWTRDTALRMHLSGWVRNLPDGSVEALAQGEERVLKTFCDALHRGAPLSRVAEVASTIRESSGALSGFVIQR